MSLCKKKHWLFCAVCDIPEVEFVLCSLFIFAYIIIDLANIVTFSIYMDPLHVVYFGSVFGLNIFYS